MYLTQYLTRTLLEYDTPRCKHNTRRKVIKYQLPAVSVNCLPDLKSSEASDEVSL